MSTPKKHKYYKGLQHRDHPELITPREHVDDAKDRKSSFSRRDFLMIAGFTVGSAVVTGCDRAPANHAIPFLVKPEEIVPGESLWYASACHGCRAGCGLLIKQRDGRPIKLEGLPDHPLSHGGLCAVGQASLLGLYDDHRLKHPLANGSKADWKQVDQAIKKQLDQIRSDGGTVRFVSDTVTSPTAQQSIDQFLSLFKDSRHVVYDPISHSAILDAHGRTHRSRVLPQYHLDQADVIVSFDADFLGTWISPVQFAHDYRVNRVPDEHHPEMSYHAQFESRMSLTGSNADKRYRIKPQQIGRTLSHLAVHVAQLAGESLDKSELGESPVDQDILKDLAKRLYKARGKSLVLCGSNNAQDQLLTNYLNHILGNYGSTIDIKNPSLQRQGDDQTTALLLDELKQGKVAVLFISDVNMLYDLPGSEALANAIKQVPLVVSFAPRVDETAELANYVCPQPHSLESWGDIASTSSHLTITQPGISPMGKTRPLTESLAAWSGKPGKAYDILRRYWEKEVYPRRTIDLSFNQFWDRAVHDGFVEIKPQTVKVSSFKQNQVKLIANDNADDQGKMTLVLYPKVSMLDGRHANNAWLQELPDPVSKVTWDNYASISPDAAETLGVTDGDVLQLTASADGSKQSLELPAFIQPGQHDQVIAVALGYGCKGTDRFAKVGPQWFEAKSTVGENGLVGVNASPLLQFADGNLSYLRSDITISKTTKHRKLASTQLYGAIAVPANVAPPGAEGPRDIIQETTLDAFAKDPSAGATVAHHSSDKQLWAEDHTKDKHNWAMVLDLNACTGCSGCIIACQAENNVPVVGRDEVSRQREMHWLRVDRYYSGDGDDTSVSHQPMMCHHCDNAPCETVCPVLATVHSEEGLNQQVYNRCVGTRYCANNCPYKVRRFNWFNYPHNDVLQNLVLNPDVTVRSRGVMEKCSMCVQRIQEEKIKAKREGKEVQDGDIQMACQQSCPAQAIYFGDLNDPESKVSKLTQAHRNYKVLEELNVRPSVSYLRQVRNRENGGATHG